MKTNQQTNVLECMHGPFNRGGRERTPIDAEMVPVCGRTTIVSLAHACLAAGLMEDVRDGGKVNWEILGDLSQQKWRGRIEAFFADAQQAGISPQAADRWADTVKGAVIGWTMARIGWPGCCNGPFGVCTDANMALAILGRRVGDIFFANRNPDYCWEALFGTAFAFDEDIVQAASLKRDPWKRFKWHVEE